MILLHYGTIVFSGTVSVICVLLILHPAYRNRLIRLLGLGIIAIAGFARAGSMLIGDAQTPSPIGVLLWFGLFLFFMSHVCSFVKRLRVRHTEKWYAETTQFSVKDQI